MHHLFVVMLDNKEVNEATRQFLHSWQANKDAKRQQRKHLRHQDTDLGVHNDLPPLKFPHQTSDGTYIVQHSGHFPRQNKQFAAILTKAAEAKSRTIPVADMTTR